MGQDGLYQKLHTCKYSSYSNDVDVFLNLTKCSSRLNLNKLRVYDEGPIVLFWPSPAIDLL